jgi:L-fuculose-phosphate aldolase
MQDVEKDIRERMCKMAARMWDEGLTTKTGLYWGGGNISMRVPETERILIKPSGFSFGNLKPKDFIVVDLFGKVLEGENKPSSETPMHTTIYRKRDDVGSVVHTHSFYADIMGIAGVELLPILFSGGHPALMKGVKIAPWRRGGTQEIADIAAEYLKDCSATLLQYHGCIVIGKDIEGAYHLASKVEELAKKQWMAMQVGKPGVLPEKTRNAMLEGAKKRGMLV